MLSFITLEFIFKFIIVFSRIAGMMVVIPGLSDARIPIKIRLSITVWLSLVLIPFLAGKLPDYDPSIIKISYYIISDFLIGFILGSSVRFIFSSIFVLGNLVSMQSGLSASSIFDPSQKEQIMLFTSFLSNVAIIFLITSNNHHKFIAGIAESYDYLKSGVIVSTGDIATQATKIMSETFELSLKISAPFIIIGMAIMVGSGVLSRLMPTLQVLFVISPGQILVMYCILFVVINNILESVIEKMVNVFY